MQWKGLWHLFARHGDVVRTFIARKLSRGGKRFGFVRFENNIDAERAMERLNGFTVYGYKLMVKKAFQNKRGWVVVREREQLQSGREERKQVSSINASNLTQEVSLKKVVGQVNDEELWNLQKCLVGETTLVCSVKSIADRIEAWGLNGIRVQRMGRKTFLLSFEDEDLFIMLEDLEWAYLKEIL
ncbi:hypothetical protein V6N13_084024 [Hibiscus sabdariffa]